jgi:hypothetical protein
MASATRTARMSFQHTGGSLEGTKTTFGEAKKLSAVKTKPR